MKRLAGKHNKESPENEKSTNNKDEMKKDEEIESGSNST